MLTTRVGAPFGVALGVVLAALSGCSRDNVARDVAAMNTSNIQRLANLYSAFQNYRGGRGPNDEAEFKQFVKEFDKAKLTMMGVDPDKVDSLFISERDGKPFFVRYQVGGGRGSVEPVVIEQDGQGGRKQVAYTGNSKVEEVDDARAQALRSSKGSSATPAPAPSQLPTNAGGPAGRPAGAPTGPPGK